ncbi:hypothetical protein IMZ31_20855 (plasmid) [Pontibacillus sp. ALD_SL1]|uniref:hypothetical protein n=1 Tax=Pontibacillus sp. ALD_SL1 TaxID=2777185 RepID=UPI001A973E20|nr:hypothetical protein [Pontibacillus sp. ALD_SL1]QST03000.1 hypothetical protein IMZ31_20855 [Pontibacillus sp. ALD_SL1]
MSKTKTEQVLEKMKASLDAERSFGMYIKAKRFKELLMELETEFKSDFKDLADVYELRDQIVKERDRILREAEEEAELIRSRAENAVQEADIAKEAERYAHDIVIEAEKEVAEKQEEVDAYSKNVIVRTHRYLDQMLDTINKEFGEYQDKLHENRETLRKNLVEEIREEATNQA